MKKNIIVKIFAFLALFGIIVGILGTGILFFIAKKSNVVENKPQITQEELNKLIDNIKSSSGDTQTGELDNNTILNITGSGVSVNSGELNNKK